MTKRRRCDPLTAIVVGALLLMLLPALLVVAGDEGVETGEALTALVLGISGVVCVWWLLRRTSRALTRVRGLVSQGLGGLPAPDAPFLPAISGDETVATRGNDSLVVSRFLVSDHESTVLSIQLLRGGAVRLSRTLLVSKRCLRTLPFHRLAAPETLSEWHDRTAPPGAHEVVRVDDPPGAHEVVRVDDRSDESLGFIERFESVRVVRAFVGEWRYFVVRSPAEFPPIVSSHSSAKDARTAVFEELGLESRDQ
ncbi:MAG: hypothetical protein VYE22_23430 [Myxococcota bacterium]|nr:hypothetical protein [Myxococcota bacterium]